MTTSTSWPDLPSRRLSAFDGDKLSDQATSGSNPGALRARAFIPLALPKGAPLVVVLHGAGQSAADYNRGSGWSHLAEQSGFAVLYPEQRRSNNVMGCFNWYEAGDNKRAAGEALSIRQMSEALIVSGDIDRNRVFVTGLSAGGAMAVVMLATYPDVFAGGAVIAGLPYGSARGVLQAMDRMNGLGGPSADELEGLARGASAYGGRWPTLSVWHGSLDRTVHASNVERLLGQWRSLHNLRDEPSSTNIVDGCPRRTWRDDGGRAVIESYTVPGLGHGTPLDVRAPAGLGEAGSYMLQAKVSSTRLIARFWDILGQAEP